MSVLRMKPTPRRENLLTWLQSVIHLTNMAIIEKMAHHLDYAAPTGNHCGGSIILREWFLSEMNKDPNNVDEKKKTCWKPKMAYNLEEGQPWTITKLSSKHFKTFVGMAQSKPRPKDKNLWQNLKVGFHRLSPFSMTETQKMFHLYICKVEFHDGSKNHLESRISEKKYNLLHFYNHTRLYIDPL